MTEPPGWRIVVAPSADKTLRRLSRTDRDRIRRAISSLPAGDTRKLVGDDQKGSWRLRVGDWRVFFDRDELERIIDVTAVRPRGSAYKR